MRTRTRSSVVISLLALAACGEGTVSPGSTQVSLLLTDAPGDVEAVWVDVLHAYMRSDGEQIDLLDGPTGLIELRLPSSLISLITPENPAKNESGMQDPYSPLIESFLGKLTVHPHHFSARASYRRLPSELPESPPAGWRL